MKSSWLRLHVVVVALLMSPALVSQSSRDISADEKHLDEVRQMIAGREEARAEEVFKNIELLHGKKASRLPGMMKALTGLLGVGCDYCHVTGHWELEEKDAKVTARKHFAMQSTLNDQYFNGENKISCWTCHHGKPKAELTPDQ